MSSNSSANTTTSNNKNNTQVPEKPPIRWIKSMELSYEVPSESEQQPSSSSSSSSTAASASKATSQPQANSCSLSDSKKKEIRDTLWRSIRFYATPYSIFHSQTLGRGFCFIQSPNTIFQISLLPEVFKAVELQKLKKNTNNNKQQKQEKVDATTTETEKVMQMQIPSRNVLIHHMTLKEYDSELCMKADFELCSVREELIKAVNEHKRKEEMVLLMRFRCGHVALGVVNPPMQPDYKLALSLGRTYFGHDTSGQALQLNLDDM